MPCFARLSCPSWHLESLLLVLTGCCCLHMPGTPAESLWKGWAACVAYRRVRGLLGSWPMSLMCPIMWPFLLLEEALPQYKPMPQ